MSDRSPELWGEDVPIKAVVEAAQRVLGATEGKTRSERARKGKANKAIGRLLHKKTIELYQAKGYFAFSVDSTSAARGGAVYSSDLLGVADIMAVRGCEVDNWNTLPEVLLIQSTTADRRTFHELKYVKPDNIDKRTQRSAYDNLIDWFSRGGEFVLVCWAKDGSGRWQPTIHELDAAWLKNRRLAYEARKR